VIAIDSIKSMGWGSIQKMEVEEALYCPMIDARRMEVYTGVYDSKLQIVRAIDADIVEPDTYRDFLEQKRVYFFGDGAEKCQSTIQHPNAVFVEQNASAKNMGVPAFEAFQNKAFEDVAYFEPFYLKEFVALKSKKKLV
ncbi:MAG: tRNA (adenosine(37)-N6)-threonylcarbamoyltransferase complex dimerization subunit type 1 TsaB, partial [Vicingaceae bacterium]